MESYNEIIEQLKIDEPLIIMHSSSELNYKIITWAFANGAVIRYCVDLMGKEELTALRKLEGERERLVKGGKYGNDTNN